MSLTGEPIKKVFILTLPSLGHVLPVACVVERLVKLYNIESIFYGIEEHREIIEKTGSTFRLIRDFPVKCVTGDPLVENKHPFIGLLYGMISISDRILIDLIDDYERDRPHLIIYDTIALHAKYLLLILKERFSKKLTNTPPPLSVHFSTTFASYPGIYPTLNELQHLQKPDIWFHLHRVVLFFMQLKLNWKYGIGVYDSVGFLLNPVDDLVIVTCFPEFQPKADLFDSRFKFVGSCVSERVRKVQIDDERLNQLLVSSSDKSKLVYASLGTVFNNNFYIYEEIIDAVRQLNTIRSDLEVVISTGQVIYEKYQIKIKQEGYSLPPNVLLLPFVPQIEVLKKASVFISHGGMNSAIEAIQYSVPSILIPLRYFSTFQN